MIGESDSCILRWINSLYDGTFNATEIEECFKKFKIPTAELSCTLNYDRFYITN
jgi:hypothetical protein